MYSGKLRKCASVMVFFLVLGLFSLPVRKAEAAAYPYFNHFGADATAENKYGFDSFWDRDNNGVKGSMTVAEDPDEPLNKAFKYTATKDPYVELFVSKEEIAKPLAISMRVKQELPEGFFLMMFRREDGKFIHLYKQDQNKSAFLPDSVSAESATPSTSEIRIAKKNDGKWKKAIVMLDLKNKSANVFYNGEYTQYGAKLKYDNKKEDGSDAGGLFRIQGNRTADAASAETVTYLDDLKIYSKQPLTMEYSKGLVETTAKRFSVIFSNEMNPSAVNKENVILEKKTESGFAPVSGYTVAAKDIEKTEKTELVLSLPELEPSSVYQIRFGEEMKDVFGQPASEPVSFSTGAAEGAPKVTLAVQGAETVKEGADITLTGTVADASVSAKTEIILDDVPQSLTVADGSFTHTVVKPAVGRHKAYVRVTDGEKTGISPVVNYTVVENRAPEISWISPVSDKTTYDLKSGSKKISVKAIDADGKVQKVELFDGENSLGAMAAQGDVYSVETELAEGTHTLKAVATDDGGKVSQAVVSVKVVDFKETKIGSTYGFDDYTDTTGTVVPSEFDVSYLNAGKILAENGGVKILMDSSGGSGPCLGKTFTPSLTGRVAVETDLTLHGTGSRSLFVVRADGVPGETGTYWGTPLEVNGGKLYLKDAANTVLAEMKEDTPYTLKLVWDMDNGLADVYLNGVKLIEQVPFAKSDKLGSVGIPHWRMITQNYGAPESYTIMDNITFYQLKSEEKTVSLAEPADGTEVEAGTEIGLRADPMPAGLTAVKFYDGDKEIGSVTGAPYTFNYVVTEGRHELTAKAFYEAQEVTSAPVAVTGVVRKWNPVDEQNFDDPKAGEAWLTEKVVKNGTIAYVDGAVKVTSEAEGAEPYIGKHFSPEICGTVMLEATYSFAKTQTWRELMMVRNQYPNPEDSKNPFVEFITPLCVKYGNLYFGGAATEGNLLQPIEEGVDYNIRLVWNTKTKAVDVYVNGALKALQKKLAYNDRVQDVQTVRFITDKSATIGASTTVDNVKISVEGIGPQVTAVKFDGAEGTENIPISVKTIQVIFDADPVEDGLKNWVTVTDKEGGRIDYTGVYNKAEKTYTMTLETALQNNAQYTLKVDKNLKGSNYQTMGKDYVCTFTTADIPVKVSSVIFKDDTGQPLNALKAGTVKAEVRVTRQDAGEALVLLALYNDKNVLEQIQTKKMNFGEAGEQSAGELSVRVPESAAGYQLRVLVFESEDSMKPVPFKLPQGQKPSL